MIPSVQEDITYKRWCNRFLEASFCPVQCFFICPLHCIMPQTFSTNLHKPNMKTGTCIEVMYIHQYELFYFFNEIYWYNLITNKGWICQLSHVFIMQKMSVFTITPYMFQFRRSSSGESKTKFTKVGSLCLFFERYCFLTGLFVNSKPVYNFIKMVWNYVDYNQLFK